MRWVRCETTVFFLDAILPVGWGEKPSPKKVTNLNYMYLYLSFIVKKIRDRQTSCDFLTIILDNTWIY